MTSIVRAISVLSSTCLLLAASASTALAAGYDTPILYSARHMGMGGTAIGYVNDPSGIFHNPAGLAHVKKASALVDISFLTGSIKSRPSEFAPDTESEPIVSPAFLLGGAFRLTDWMTAGFGLYPLAAAGGGYKYDNLVWSGGNPLPIEDSSKLVLIEASPALAFNLPGNVNLGLGYRIGYAMLDRNKSKEDSDEPAMLGLSAAGVDLSGIRAGLQWSPIEGLHLGLVYRTEIEAEMTGEANLGADSIPQADTSLLLAPKLGAGIRYDIGGFAAAFDFEYLWTERDEVQKIVGTTFSEDSDGNPVSNEVVLNNVMLWQNAVTLRGGLEARLDTNTVARVGYVYDGQVGNESFPSAFGTPPTETHSVTVGAGYNPGPWQVNIAYALRMGDVTVTQADLDDGEDQLRAAFGVNDDGELNVAECDTCSYPGDYAITLHGIYIDFSYSWGDDETPEPSSGP